MINKFNFLALLFTSLFCLQATAADPVKVIFDTDMDGDCDDAGALAVLNALADAGETEILAVVTNRRGSSGASAAACDVINTYYGRGDIPIGTDKDGAKIKSRVHSTYAPALRDEFPHDSLADDSMPDAIDVYRSTLASQPDASVVICSVGALSNLEDLLNSPADSHSKLTGTELIEQKVRKTVIMGGAFPRSSKPETNIILDVPAAVAVVNRWPGEIIWQGFEIGAALHCGQTLKQVSAKNPVRRAFELRPFMGGFAIDRGKPAHDQAAVLLAVRGIEPSLWKPVRGGRVIVDSDGHTEYRRGQAKSHTYVEIKGRPDRLTKIIDDLMTTKP
tara:strand:- start:189867 stop:190865 length:999 start_codon:yes stop_codon:yes gene_type:complete